MIIAYHMIFGAYGFWLPNDPRGSRSTTVWGENLQPFGPATQAPDRRSSARDAHDFAQRRQAKRALKYPPVKFSGIQARAVVRGVEDICGKLSVEIYALAIMPDHMHVVARRHELQAEGLGGFLIRAATRQLNREGLNPMARFRRPSGRTISPWAVGDGWPILLDSAQAVWRAIRYVEQNPVRAGLPRQYWKFIVPFEG